MEIPSWDLSQIITSYNAAAVIKNVSNLYLSGKIRFQSARGKTGLLCISFGQQLNTDTQLNKIQLNTIQLNSTLTPTTRRLHYEVNLLLLMVICF